MRFFMINGDYAVFLSWFYTTHPGLAERPYDEQLQVRHHSLYGMDQRGHLHRNLRF